jgi:hypothetical protein
VLDFPQRGLGNEPIDELLGLLDDSPSAVRRAGLEVEFFEEEELVAEVDEEGSAGSGVGF